MKTKINNWLFKIAMKIFAKRIIRKWNLLTPKHLLDRGWVEKDGYYFEPNIKDRDRISISFENHYYRVWHSEKLTFIAIEGSLEWFEVYYLLMHPDNGRSKLSGK